MNKVRTVWDEEQEKYYFSVVDIVQVLTGSFDYQQAHNYWKVLKGRLIKEGNESVTNCYQLKLPSSDRKKYKFPCTFHFFVVISALPFARVPAEITVAVSCN